ncbi:hypothetical protein Tco_0529272 [Tanacetum coccineum]
MLTLNNSILSDMSNSDELRHTDNTTLVPPRLPDTLPQVYHKRLPTLGLLILPSVPSFSPTIRRTARISIPPIEPNLAERARISAINLDDSINREEALTETGQNLVPVPETVLPYARRALEDNCIPFTRTWTVSQMHFCRLRSLQTLWNMDRRLVMLRIVTDRKERGQLGGNDLAISRNELELFLSLYNTKHEKMAPGRRPTVRRNPPVNRSTNRNNVDINSGIDTQNSQPAHSPQDLLKHSQLSLLLHAASTSSERNNL